MKDRIKQLRKTLHFNQADFAQRLGVSQQTISDWEKGARVPPWTRLLICSVFHVRREWLEEGAGEVFDKTLTDAAAAQRDFCLRAFASLPPDIQEKVLDALRAYLERRDSFGGGGASITVDNSPGSIIAGQINGTVNGANFGGEEEEEEE